VYKEKLFKLFDCCKAEKAVFSELSQCRQGKFGDWGGYELSKEEAKQDTHEESVQVYMPYRLWHRRIFSESFLWEI
jgi:hypothetical protein